MRHRFHEKADYTDSLNVELSSNIRYAKLKGRCQKSHMRIANTFLHWIVYKQPHWTGNALLVAQSSHIGQAGYTHCSCAETIFGQQARLAARSSITAPLHATCEILEWPNHGFVF